jgi:hypothetical protein
LNNYLVPKPKLERLLQVYFYTYPLCDSLVQKQQIQIDTLYNALEASKNLSDIYILQRDNKATELKILQEKASYIKTIHEAEIRHIKRQKFKVTLIAISEAVLIVLLVL